MPKISVNEIELFYEFRGQSEGPTIVFVNGLLTDTASWNGHLPFFEEHYGCLVYDCRGQGQSDKPDQTYETQLHIADLAALVDALEIGQAHFVGLSNGGAAVLAYAAMHPERVLSVVACGAYAAVDTILRVKLTSWVRAMEAGGSPLRFDVAVPWVWGGRFLEKNYETLLYFRDKGANMPIEWATNLIKGAMVHDISDLLGQITAPALIIVGEDDVLTPPQLSLYIAESVPGAVLHIMPGIGHAAALEDVPGFSQLVLNFIAELPANTQHPAPNTQHSVSAGDLDIHYIVKGAGQPVVFIHGNWATSSWWEPVLERLPDGYRGIAYDLRGRGLTTGPDNDYTMPELAADLRAFADALSLEQFHLVGHSLGSAVAMQFALDNPGRVRTLVALAPAWVDGMPEAFNSPASQMALKNNHSVFGQVLKAIAPGVPDDEFWQRLVDEGHKQGTEATLRNLPALVAWQPGDKLREISAPVLVINGSLDTLTGAYAERAAQALGARHVVLENIGHSPNLESPDRFVELLLEHIDQQTEEKL